MKATISIKNIKQIIAININLLNIINILINRLLFIKTRHTIKIKDNNIIIKSLKNSN
jgi:hypothetical protein